MPKNKNHHLFKHDQTEQTRKNDPLQHTCWKTHSLILTNLHLTFIKSVDSKDQLQGSSGEFIDKIRIIFQYIHVLSFVINNFIYFLICHRIDIVTNRSFPPLQMSKES